MVQLNKYEIKENAMIKMIMERGRPEDAEARAKRWLIMAGDDSAVIERRKQALRLLGMHPDSWPADD